MKGVPVENTSITYAYSFIQCNEPHEFKWLEIVKKEIEATTLWSGDYCIFNPATKQDEGKFSVFHLALPNETRKQGVGIAVEYQEAPEVPKQLVEKIDQFAKKVLREKLDEKFEFPVDGSLLTFNLKSSTNVVDIRLFSWPEKNEEQCPFNSNSTKRKYDVIENGDKKTKDKKQKIGHFVPGEKVYESIQRTGKTFWIRINQTRSNNEMTKKSTILMIRNKETRQEIRTLILEKTEQKPSHQYNKKIDLIECQDKSKQNKYTYLKLQKEENRQAPACIVDIIS